LMRTAPVLRGPFREGSSCSPPKRLSVAPRRATYASSTLFTESKTDKRNRDPRSGSPMICGNPARVPAAQWTQEVGGLVTRRPTSPCCMPNGGNAGTELCPGISVR
jgi:hypothetical protein